MLRFFVDPSQVAERRPRPTDIPPRKIFWCGGTIDWKRVDTLLEGWRLARKANPELSLLIVGQGQMDEYLRKLAGEDAVENFVGWQPGKVCFAPYQRHEKVRELMREADVYVMPSDGKEGWGAAVSDALAEGCPVLSTYEAGSSATILPEDCLFHAGDSQRLADLLMQPVNMVKYAMDEWGGLGAAKNLVAILKERK